MSRPTPPRTNIQKRGHARARNSVADLVRDVRQSFEDSGISGRALCRAAGIGPNTLLSILEGDRQPTIEVMSRICSALGGELRLGYRPGAGPALRDHLQAAMLEALGRLVGPRWAMELEVPVFVPSPGFIDVVLTDQERGALVAGEAHSEIRRLEQQLRWAHAKAGALGVVRPGSSPPSTMLLLRATSANRAIVIAHAAMMRAAYPGTHEAAVRALTGSGEWPGPSIVWMQVHGGVASVSRRPPRGVP